jgi:FkbM family methyltransferase
MSSLEFRRRDLLTVDDEMREVSIEGRRLSVYVGDTGPSSMMLNGSYEPDVTKVIVELLAPTTVFLDIGANVGYYTMLAAGIATEGTVISIEPSVRNVRAIRSGIQLNGFTNVEIINAAATTRWELLAFGSTGSNGTVGDLGAGESSVDIVQGVPLDQALATLEQLDVIKIDVEGAELIALRGAQTTIERFRPVIVSEFSPPAIASVSGGSGPEYLQFLFDLGYQVAAVLPDGTLSHETDDVDEAMRWFSDTGSDHIDILARPH